MIAHSWWVPLAVTAVVVTARRQSARWWGRWARSQLAAANRVHAGPHRWRPDAGWPALIEAVTTRFRRPRPMADDVAPTLEAVARAVAAGVGLGPALAALPSTPANRPFAALLASAGGDHRLGADLATAVAASAVPGSEPEVTLALAVLEVAAEHGGATASALHRVASAIRERRAVVAERAVQSAQARSSALVLTLVPVAFGSWTALTDHRVARFLFTTPAGAACVIAGLGANAAGWWWMRRIIRGPS